MAYIRGLVRRGNYVGLCVKQSKSPSCRKVKIGKHDSTTNIKWCFLWKSSMAKHLSSNERLISLLHVCSRLQAPQTFVEMYGLVKHSNKTKEITTEMFCCSRWYECFHAHKQLHTVAIQHCEYRLQITNVVYSYIPTPQRTIIYSLVMPNNSSVWRYGSTYISI